MLFYFSTIWVLHVSTLQKLLNLAENWKSLKEGIVRHQVVNGNALGRNIDEAFRVETGG